MVVRGAILLIASAAALFEDQAGKVDWYRQQIGQAKHALFHSAGQQRLALVATEPGVVAGLDLRTGAVAWRSVLPEGEDIAVLQPYGKSLLSVSTTARGAYVRLWSMTGGVTWDAHIPAVASPNGASPPEALITGGAIVVAWQASARAFHAGSGELLWKWTQDGARLTALLTPATPSTAAATTGAGASGSAVPPVHVYGVTKDGEAFVAVLEDNDDKAARASGAKQATSVTTLRSSFMGGLTPSGVMLPTLDRAHVAMVDTTGTKLLLHAVGTSSLAAHPIPSLAAGQTATLVPSPLPAMLLLKSSDGSSLVLALGAKAAAPTLVHAVDDPSAFFALTTSREGKAVLALGAKASAAALSLQTMQVDADGSHGEWSASEPLPYDSSSFGSVSDAWLNSYTRKDGSFGHRLLLSSSDHSLQLLQAGKDGSAQDGGPSWLRDEALASVRTSEMLPLPALATDTDEDAPVPSFAFALPAIIDGMRRRSAEVLSGPGAAAEGPPPTHADSYGFRQVIVSATTAGKVYGLHSSDGSTLWSRRIPKLSEEEEAEPALPFLFVCRGAGHPEAVLVAQGETSWRVDAINPFTGKVLPAPSAGATSGSGKIVHAARLDSLGAADGSTRPPVMLVDDALNVHVYPKSDTSALKAMVGDLFFYLFDPDTGSLAGYAVVSDGGKLVGQPRWSMSLPAASTSAGTGGRPPVSLAAFPAGAAINSPVRVLGDRNVLHKYINRNLLAVGIEHAGDGDFEESSIQIMLVDTVSGKIVHSVRHREASGPLTFVMGENWLVWHYWSPKSLTYQMAVSELFTNTTISDDPLKLLLGGAPDYSLRENGFDGYSHPPPHVLSQGYAFSAPIEAMAVTQTIAGITPKFILVATTSGQFYNLDKRFIDPRRPLVANPQKMSAADKEEGLVPYGPSLGGISPLAVASHKHTIARPRSIAVGITHLESTSLAVVHGLDLFMTRVAPAREFDRLNEDFNYVALIFAIVFLTVATFGSGWYSNRKDLARAWK